MARRLKQVGMPVIVSAWFPPMWAGNLTTVDKDNINVASFINTARGKSAVHIVNNAASCKAVISGLPTASTRALVQVTNAGSNAESQCLPVIDGKVEVSMPAESFVSVFAE